MEKQRTWTQKCMSTNLKMSQYLAWFCFNDSVHSSCMDSQVCAKASDQQIRSTWDSSEQVRFQYYHRPVYIWKPDVFFIKHQEKIVWTDIIISLLPHLPLLFFFVHIQFFLYIFFLQYQFKQSKFKENVNCLFINHYVCEQWESSCFFKCLHLVLTTFP